MHALESYNWPGNVRELENVIQRAAVLAAGSILMPKDLPLGGGAAGPPAAGPGVLHGLASFLDGLLGEAAAGGPKVLAALEAAAITRAVAYTEGDLDQAAVLLGLPKAALKKKYRAEG